LAQGTERRHYLAPTDLHCGGIVWHRFALAGNQVLAAGSGGGSASKSTYPRSLSIAMRLAISARNSSGLASDRMPSSVSPCSRCLTAQPGMAIGRAIEADRPVLWTWRHERRGRRNSASPARSPPTDRLHHHQSAVANKHLGLAPERRAVLSDLFVQKLIAQHG
jgi:hypothetical protein